MITSIVQCETGRVPVLGKQPAAVSPVWNSEKVTTTDLETWVNYIMRDPREIGVKMWTELSHLKTMSYSRLLWTC
jgi:hypothetical protein